MSDLSDRVRSLAATDRRGAPPFDGTMRAARGRARPPRPFHALPAVSAVALGTIFALAIVSRMSPGRSDETVLARARELSAWSAPTAVFLDPFDRTLTDSTPTLALTSVVLPESETQDSTRSLP